MIRLTRIDAVKDDSHVFEPLLPIELIERFQALLGRNPVTYYKQGCISMVRHHLGVRNDTNWRGVEDDVLKPLAQQPDELFHGRAT